MDMRDGPNEPFIIKSPPSPNFPNAHNLVTLPFRFSLIVATMGRTEELSRLLASLERQGNKQFEVIIVDQNGDDRLLHIVGHWASQFPIHHLRSQPGLSRARNKGLGVATGELVAFPDDDCWYPDGTLAKVDDWFRRHSEFDFLSGCAETEDHRMTAGNWLSQSCEIIPKNVFRTAISFTLFSRHAPVKKIHGFDEKLGLGAGTPWGSGEESDLVFRLISVGSRGWFERSLVVFHPEKAGDTSKKAVHRAYSYGVGFGYLLRQHKLSLPFSLYACARPAIGWLLALASHPRKAPVYLATFRGRVAGFFEFQARS